MITRNKLYLNVKNLLESVDIEAANFEAACMLESVYGIPCDKIKFDEETVCTDEEFDKVQAMLEKRIVGYPLQYLVGEWEFYGYNFKVGEGVLIPRADTETIIDFVLDEYKGEKPRIIDLCSGSGCIAITLAKRLSTKAYAVEFSEEAGKYLRENIALNEVNVECIMGDVLLESTKQLLPTADIIVCNPPYLTLDDMGELQEEVSYEPSMALYGGEDGLDFYRKISAEWKEKLSDGGMIVFEIGMGQGRDVTTILEENGYTEIDVKQDLANHTGSAWEETVKTGGLLEMAMNKKTDSKKSLEIPKNAEDKKKALETAIAQIEKQYGAGAVMRLGQATAMNVDVISTGSLTLDLALGVGGVPKGRIVEVYGPESSGKTTVSLHMVAEAQKKGGTAAFIDVEHALDPVYAKQLGVDVDNMLVSQPDSGEQALEIAEALVRSGAIDIIVLDSVAAMVTKAEIDGEMGDTHVGLLARLMSQAMRKLTSVIGKSNCVAIFINQVREKIGVMYGNPETTPGGRALKFYSTVRIEVRKGEAIKNGAAVIGNRTKCKVVKNKVAPPFKECEFDIMYGEGISKIGEILDMATELDIVKKGGAWYSYNDVKIGQGRDNAKQYLVDNPDICDEIERLVIENKSKIVLASKKNKKLAAVALEADLKAKISDAKPTADLKVDISAEDDFEEFTPVE